MPWSRLSEVSCSDPVSLATNTWKIVAASLAT